MPGVVSESQMAWGVLSQLVNGESCVTSGVPGKFHTATPSDCVDWVEDSGNFSSVLDKNR